MTKERNYKRFSFPQFNNVYLNTKINKNEKCHALTFALIFPNTVYNVYLKSKSYNAVLAPHIFWEKINFPLHLEIKIRNISKILSG